MDFQRNLREYAKLAVRVGVNIQPEQGLFVQAPVQAAEFTHLIVDEAYQAGARVVDVEWSDGYVRKARLSNSPLDELKIFPQWRVNGILERAKSGYAFLTVVYPQPGLMDDIPVERHSASQQAILEGLSEFIAMQMSHKVRWCGISVATPEWANRVFPGLHYEERLLHLWGIVFNITRVNQENPLKAWEHHISSLRYRTDNLNGYRFSRLHYKSPVTDLTIELPRDHVWQGGVGRADNIIQSIPNIPTEEVFTAPMRTGVNGYVTSTKPVVFNDHIIEGIRIVFQNGRIVDFTAEKGYEVLKSIIETDEGSHYLGELALVPYSSPISRTGLTFYDILYDENASCHLAIGAAYPACIKNGTEMSKVDQLAKGLNNSLIHVDFMIGSKELNIDGETEDSKVIPLFRNGEWV
ncbi:aminopeptidase [Alicyclobacillus ferrooxydans]|uniref:Peptidase M29 n=1 Tax=Alicyclobacillus ferrooxydans TaxID=471514 RepID=A0A0N8PPY7_9BACL|nr:aminopeptidase [Alicyclobacillus ferrooxydans]KPV45637.1 hypothetical protein AN477_01605 [Alicyclobacillus ferrooxydans]